MMLDNLFGSIFETSAGVSEIQLQTFLISMVVSLILGFIVAGVHMYKNVYSKGFITTLAILPISISVVIMMVNGNVGTGVAVAGAFGLVRFRSMPGTAKEISSVFLAMAVGLATGMGFIGYAIIFVIIVEAVNVMYTALRFGEPVYDFRYKTLRITIPEDLDYGNIFDDLFAQYLTRHELISVRTTNMGSLYRLTYNITLKSVEEERAFIDALRCRNGNLEISSSKQETQVSTLNL